MTYADCKIKIDKVLADLCVDFHTKGRHRDMQDSIINLANGLDDVNERIKVLEDAA